MKRRTPLIVFVILLAAQSALVFFHVPNARLTGDEPYYVEKARYLVEHGHFPKARPGDLEAERGGGGNSDWRPQGYPAFVALASGGEFEMPALRRRVAIAQLALVLVAVAVAWILCGRTLLAALILGISPWPYAFVTQIISDSLNASITFLALALLYRWAAGLTSRAAVLFAGAFLASSALLVRPEMAALAPLSIAVALLIRRERGELRATHVAMAVSALAIILGIQFTYRVYFSGRVEPVLFGGQHIFNRGAFDWANTWIGTEAEGYDFVYGIGRKSVNPLPGRAFADEAERAEVEALIERVRAEGYTPEVDAAFATLAEKRKTEHPFLSNVLPRLWHAAHGWANTDTSEQLLLYLASWPRPLRRGLLGALLLLKATLLMWFCWRTARHWRTPMIAIMGSFVIARTVLIGIVFNWMVNRMLLVAWLPLLVVCLAKRDESR